MAYQTKFIDEKGAGCVWTTADTKRLRRQLGNLAGRGIDAAVYTDGEDEASGGTFFNDETGKWTWAYWPTEDAI